MTKTLEQFLFDENINPKDLLLLGSGASGKAYHYHLEGSDYVIKETVSYSEYLFAEKALRNLNPNKNAFAEIYEIAANEKYYYIISEYLDTDDWKLTRYYEKFTDEVRGVLLTNGMRMDLTNIVGREYLLDTVVWENDSEEYQEFRKQVLVIFDAYLQVGANDIHEGNLGYTSSGLLKAFDIDVDDSIKLERPQNKFKSK